ncbi:hypothetical protein [Jiangella asiatica]|nr:hypothetical protein [Jiangella asiatica]
MTIELRGFCALYYANASVVAPFGNVLGLMYDPHRKAMADGEAAA